MTLNHRRAQAYIRMICGECVHYSTHTLVERLVEKHPRPFPPSLKAVSPFYSGSNTRSSFTLFTTENDGNGGSGMSGFRSQFKITDIHADFVFNANKVYKIIKVRHQLASGPRAGFGCRRSIMPQMSASIAPIYRPLLARLWSMNRAKACSSTLHPSAPRRWSVSAT